MVPTRTIAIIGAGAAGLAAARDLARAGRSVVVLEARDRIGGRVFTLQDDDFPSPVELGAEFVHGKSPALWKLATRANLKFYEVSERHWFFEDGKITKSRDFWRQVEYLMDQMRAAGSDESLKAFLDWLPDDEETRDAKSMVTRYVEGFHAANSDRIGIQGLVKANEAADSIDGDKAFRFQNGYDSLMQALRAEAESYGATFSLNTIVKEIRWTDETLKVIADSAAKHAAYNASVVVLAVPLSILQAGPEDGGIRFVPDLPATKQAAIQSLAVGNVIRINLQFRERFWEEVKLWDEDGDAVSFRDAGFFHYPDAPVPTWWTQLPVRAPLLVGWAGGPRTDQVRGSASGGGSNDGVLAQALSSLSLIFNLPPDEIRQQLVASHHHDWHDDPFSRGAYCYVPVNGLKAQELLSQPVAHKLFFAGEATCAGHIGTVHGAIQSGQRAADEILNL
jgi:monoamine oxidase